MSNFRSFDDLNNFPARDPFSRVANQLRATLCGAYDRFPGLFLPPPLPGTRAIREANRDFFEDTVCPPPDIPGVNPPAQFVPGCDVIYDVRITYRARPDGSPITQVRDGSNIVRAEGYPVGNDRVRLDMFQADGQNVGRFYIANNVPPDFPGFEVLDVKVERRDGQPVNTPCTVPPVVNPEVIIPPNITVQIGGSPTTVNITPVTYNVDGNTYFSPSFNTSIGPIEFTLGGVNFGPIFLPPIVPIGPGGGGGPTINEIQNVVNQGNQEVTTNISNILEDRSAELAAYIRCLIERPNEQIEPVPLTSSNAGGINVLPSGTFAVVVSRAGNIGPGTRIQSGSNGLPNVVYWGWCATGRNGNYSPRKQLSYDDSIIFVGERENEILVNPVFNNLYSAIALVASNPCVFEE